MQATKKIGLLLGSALFFLIQFSPITLVSDKTDAVIAVAIWMMLLVGHRNRKHSSYSSATINSFSIFTCDGNCRCWR